MKRVSLVSLLLPGLMAQSMYTDCREAANSLSEFSLPTLDGSGNTSLAEFSGKVVLVTNVATY